MNDEYFEASSYEEAKQRLKTNITIPTMGGRTTLKTGVRNNQIFVENGSKVYEVDSALWEAVSQRLAFIKDIKDKNMSSFYSDPKWKDCPNRVACPYIASVMKHLYTYSPVGKS